MTTAEHPATLDHHDEADLAWHAGYAAGHRAGLDARPDATVHVPTPTRWRNVAEGDTFLGGNGSLWHVQALRQVRGGIAVTAVCGPRTFNEASVDPDEAVTVLVAMAERDAVALIAEHLGGKIIGRGPSRAPG